MAKDQLDSLIKVGRAQRDAKRRMLKALAFDANIRRAAKEADIHTFMHYYWQERDPKYKESLDVVQQVQNGVIKAELWDAATIGLDKPVLYKGKITGYYREKSIEAMKTEAKARMAEYRDGTNINLLSEGPQSITFVSGKDRPELACTRTTPLLVDKSTK